MGKTPKPLRLLIHTAIEEWPEWEAMRAQGHVIDAMEDITMSGRHPDPHEYDLVLGPTSWLMTEKHKKYLDLAIKTARGTRYARLPGVKKGC